MRVDGQANKFAIRHLATVAETQIRQLVDLLIDCVDGGASVGFMSPITLETASNFWRKVVAEVGRNERLLLVAEDADGILGSVQLILDQPPNQPHRADLSKMLVLRRARRQGIGASLMQAAEQSAQALGRSLLVLDTANGEAERLYATLGWQRVGKIPGYALLPQGGLCDTTFFYRILSPSR